MKKFFYLVAIVATVALTACGGKGSNDSSSTTVDSESAKAKKVVEDDIYCDYVEEEFPDFPASDSSYIYPENGKLTKMEGNWDDNHDFYICKVGDKVGVVDDCKRVIIPIEYDEIKKARSDCYYYLIRQGDRWGLISSHGRFILPSVLKSIKCERGYYKLTFDDGTQKTIEEGIWGDDFSQIAAFLVGNYEWGPYFYVRTDSTTKVVYVDEYYTTGKFSNGLMPVYDKNKKKVGFLNTKGEWAIPQTIPCRGMSYMHEPAFSGGCLVLEQEASDYTHYYEVYDQKGQRLWSQKLSDGTTSYSLSDYVDGGFALMRQRVGHASRSTEHWKYVSSTGKEIFPEVYGGKQFGETRGNPNDYIRPMRNGMVAFADFISYDERWGFFDKKGKVIVPGKYAKVHDFQEGLAAVQMPQDGENPNKWGFIDKTGEMVIPPTFSKEPGDFSEGLAVVEKTNGMQVYINKKGEVVSPQFARALPFLNGTAFVEVYPRDYCSERFAIDHTFNVINSYLPEEVFNTYNVARLKYATVTPKRASEALFYYSGYNHDCIYDSWGDHFFMYCDDEYKINEVSEGIVHVQYGPYNSKVDLFCDQTGKIIFYLARNEF